MVYGRGKFLIANTIHVSNCLAEEWLRKGRTEVSAVVDKGRIEW